MIFAIAMTSSLAFANQGPKSAKAENKQTQSASVQKVVHLNDAFSKSVVNTSVQTKTFSSKLLANKKVQQKLKKKKTTRMGFFKKMALKKIQKIQKWEPTKSQILDPTIRLLIIIILVLLAVGLLLSIL